MATPGFTLHVRDPQDAPCRWALEQYYAELDARFTAEGQGGFDVKLSADPDQEAISEPRGAFFLALPPATAEAEAGREPHPAWPGPGPAPLGCVALKGSGGPVAEVKRLWVSPCARQLGLGRALMAAVEQRARAMGITTLRLDTNSALPEAVAFYERLGDWHPIPRFNADPYPDLFFEKHLAPSEKPTEQLIQA